MATTKRPIAAVPVQLDAEGPELMRQVISYYHRRLQEDPAALAFLKKRCLVSSEMVKVFQLGSADRTLGLRLPLKNRKAGREMRARLNRLGILRGSGHEHLSGSLVVPIFDLDGQVSQLYGRKVTPNLRAGTPLHLFLPGSLKGIWNPQAITASKTVIVTDSIINALTWWAASYPHVTCTNGPDGPLDDLVAAIGKNHTERVFIAFRNTESGNRRAAELAGKLHGQAIELLTIPLPEGEDINDVVRASKDPAKALAGLLAAPQRGTGGHLPIEPDHRPASHPEPQAAIPTESVKVPSEPPAVIADAATSASEDRSITISPSATGDELVIAIGGHRYRARGLAKCLSLSELKVNLLVSRDGGSFHVDTLDLYSAKQRAGFVKLASAELGVGEDALRRELGTVLLQLEQAQAEQIRNALEPSTPAVSLTDAETEQALELLRDPNLMDRILSDFERCGVVGEETNKLVGYLAAMSRKLDQPLAVVIQSSSAAGKTSLMDAVLAFVPPEDQRKFASMTPQALYYVRGNDIRHKVLAILEGEGTERVTYALKLLQSEGELRIASTGKEFASGRLVTEEYVVRGPVALFFTTTATQVDEELLNRCLVLSVDEDRAQTRAIHRLQRERQTIEGLLHKGERDDVLRLHHNAQRLLRPLLVANPYAPALTFLDDRTRTRRDHLKYLTLIRVIALLHQYQREVKRIVHNGREVEFIEVDRQDIAAANRLADAVLGRSLDDLAPHTRRLLLLLEQMVAADCERQGIARTEHRFSRRQVREHLGWGDTQLKIHLRRLVELEYLAVRRTVGKGFAYELLYDGRGTDGGRFLPGLLDPTSLPYDGDRAGVGRPSVGGWSGVGRSEEIDQSPNDNGYLSASSAGESPEKGATPSIEDASNPQSASETQAPDPKEPTP